MLRKIAQTADNQILINGAIEYFLPYDKVAKLIKYLDKNGEHTADCERIEGTYHPKGGG